MVSKSVKKFYIFLSKKEFKPKLADSQNIYKIYILYIKTYNLNSEKGRANKEAKQFKSNVLFIFPFINSKCILK